MNAPCLAQPPATLGADNKGQRRRQRWRDDDGRQRRGDDGRRRRMKDERSRRMVTTCDNNNRPSSSVVSASRRAEGARSSGPRRTGSWFLAARLGARLQDVPPPAPPPRPLGGMGGPSVRDATRRRGRLRDGAGAISAVPSSSAHNSPGRAVPTAGDAALPRLELGRGRG